MKPIKFLFSLICILSFFACEDDQYPIVYEFEKTEEIGSSIVTIDSQAAFTFVDKFESIDEEICDLFESLILDPDILSITLLSESELELRFLNPNGEEMTISDTYSQGDLFLVEELALDLNPDNTITQNICGEINVAPSIPNFDAEAGFCSELVPQTFIQNKFISGDYTLGDTLGICILKRTFRKQ